MQDEGEVQRRIRHFVSTIGCKIFRNNVGAYVKEHKGVKHRVTYGLCKGSSDLIGWRRHRVTQEDVGRDIAVFVAIETKAETGGRIEKGQQEFVDAVTQDGGIAVIARGIDDVERIIELWKR